MKKEWIAAAAVVAATLIAFVAWRLYAQPGARVVIRLEPKAAGSGNLHDTMQAHLRDVQDRANSFGWTTRARVRIDGDRFVIDIAGYSDLKALSQVFGRQPPLSFRLVDDNGYDPLNDELVRNPFPDAGDEPNLPVRRTTLMMGRDVVGAKPDFDNGGRPAVDVKLDESGAREFARITRRYAGKRFALVLGHVVLTAPRIRDPVAGGELQVTGNFTVEASADLAAAINASAGDWPFTLVEARRVDR